MEDKDDYNARVNYYSRLYSKSGLNKKRTDSDD